MEKVNLLSVLSQDGHSGIIDGFCRVDDGYGKSGYSSTKDFIKKTRKSSITVAFSTGITALGTYKVRIDGIITEKSIDGHIDSDAKDPTIFITIYYNEDEIDVCRFLAVIDAKAIRYNK